MTVIVTDVVCWLGNAKIVCTPQDNKISEYNRGFSLSKLESMHACMHHFPGTENIGDQHV